jgi:hypothetical protein
MSITVSLPVLIDPVEIACCPDVEVLSLIFAIDSSMGHTGFTELLIKGLCERIRLDLNPYEYLALIKELEKIA